MRSSSGSLGGVNFSPYRIGISGFQIIEFSQHFLATEANEWS